MRKTLITAVSLLAIVGTAQANPQSSAENNLLSPTLNSSGNVARVAGSVGEIDVRGISNPGQTRVQLRGVDGFNQVQVRLKDGSLTNPGDLTDIQITETQRNKNVTDIGGTVGNLTVSGFSTPGVTKVTVTPPKN